METITIFTGEVKAVQAPAVLETWAIGSCVAVAAYDKQHKTGAMIHIMLPGKAPHKKNNSTKYAADALSLLVEKMTRMGSSINDIEVCLAGGANVLETTDGSVGRSNANSIVKILQEMNVPIAASDLGGRQRRSLRIDTGTGIVYSTTGDNTEQIFWNFN